MYDTAKYKFNDIFKQHYIRRLKHIQCMYHIRGLFGGDFNLVVWQITSESPNLSCAILFKTSHCGTVYMKAFVNE